MKMKKTIKQSMRTMLVKYLVDFGFEIEKNTATAEFYADNFVEEFERYLTAYNEFKEGLK